jgi:hypothetical protein
MRNRARYGAVIGAILLQVPSLPVRHAAGVGSGGSGGQRAAAARPSDRVSVVPCSPFTQGLSNLLE